MLEDKFIKKSLKLVIKSSIVYFLFEISDIYGVNASKFSLSRILFRSSSMVFFISSRSFSFVYNAFSILFIMLFFISSE